MKRLVMFVAAVAVAAPLLAQQQPASTSTEQKPAEQKPADPATAKAPAPKVVSGEPAAADSPLVAAAKRTKRTGKKVLVITNDNLSKAETSNAHITTTTNQRSVDIPEDPAIEAARRAEARQKALKARDERIAKENAKADAQHEEKMNRVIAHQEEAGPYSDDPAANEKILEELEKQHKAAQEQKAAQEKQNATPQQTEDDDAPPPQPKPPL